jgi:hypothetical protein
MAIGDSADIVSRVRKLLPARWFAWGAALRDALLGGLADQAAWCYSFVAYARLQSRIATGTGLWLDIIAFDFLGRFIQRGGASDAVFRALITATILKERVTRKGMFEAVKTLTGNDPWIFEPWNTRDTGAYSNKAKGQLYGQMGYGVGRGGYGNMNLPAQVFMIVIRGAPSGVAKVAGYGGYPGGYGRGSVEYIGSYSRLSGITDQQIEQLITFTKPTGVTVWLRFA